MTPKIDDHARLEFLSQFRLSIQFDEKSAWVQMADGKYCKAKTLRQAVDQAMRFTRTKERQL